MADVNRQELGIDEEKFKEVMQGVGVAHIDISTEKLQELKDKLVAEDKRYEEVELRRIKGLLDLMNSMYTGVFKYHQKYGTKPIKKEEPPKPTIPDDNKEWHKLNRLRPFATMDEKVARNLNHVANCKCSGGHIPRYVQKEIEKRMKGTRKS